MQSARHLYATLLAAWIAGFAAAPTSAQDTPSARSGGEPVEEVVVRGQRMDEVDFDLPSYIREFLGQVVALPPGGGYARWHRSVCVGVHNLEQTAAQYIVDRISMLALDVGLDPGEPGCEPQVSIIFTTDAKALATQLVEEQPELFRPYGGVCCMQLGLDALDKFASSEKAVRWWHVSLPVDVKTGKRAIYTSQDGIGNAPWMSVDGPSRIHNGVRDEMQRAIVIVDAAQLKGTTWQELGDYLAVVSLAQIDPNTDPGEFDSILNLFGNPAAYTGLTDWDRTYVRALYSIDLQRFRGMQQNQLVSRMARQERAAAEEDRAAAEAGRSSAD